MSITGDAPASPPRSAWRSSTCSPPRTRPSGSSPRCARATRTGEGQRVEVNLLSSLLGSLANQASSYLATGAAPARMGNAHPSIAPYETLRCADDRSRSRCGNDGQFRRLADVLGSPDLGRRPALRDQRRAGGQPAPRWSAAGDRPGRRPVDHWVGGSTAVGVAAGKVGDIGDAFDLAARLGLEPTRRRRTRTRRRQVRHPITYSATPVADYRRPPRSGEHNDDVRRWLTKETTA